MGTPGRLLVVSNFYPPRIVGGAEVVAHRHALLMQARGWKVAVLAGVLPSAEFPPGTVHVDSLDGIEVCRVGLRSLDPEDNFRWPLAGNVLRSLIATFRPDWMHAHNVMGLGADLIDVARRAGVRTAVTLHDNWGYCHRNTRLRNDGTLCRDTAECHLCLPAVRVPEGRLPIRLRQDFVMHRLEQADLLVSPSRDLAARYAEGGLDAQRIVVQSNGIDLAHVPVRERGRPERVRFLCAAYLGEHKGIPVLLRALERLHAAPELAGRWSMTIAGHGHLDTRVEQAIAANGWQDSVTFAGRQPREDLMRLLQDIDVVVLPSSWPENEPVILLEAIASGAAVLASRLGGNLDLVEEESSGLLFEPDDAPVLAACMRRFIEDPSLVERFGRANLRRRDAFDERATAERIEALFRTPPQSRPQRRPVIVCGGHPDPQVLVLVSLLAKALPAPRPCLLWHGWMHPDEWETADAYWHWTRDDDLWGVAEALKRDLPVIVADGPLAALLEQAGPTVHRYASARELWPAVEAACVGPPPRAPAQSQARSLYRLGLQIREREGFLMKVTS